MSYDERYLPVGIEMTINALPAEVRKHGDWPAIRPLVEKVMKRLDPLRKTLEDCDPMVMMWEMTKDSLAIGFTWDLGSAGVQIEEVGPDSITTSYQDRQPMRLNGFIAYQWWERRSRAFIDYNHDGFGVNDGYDDDPASMLLKATLERESYRRTFSIKRENGWGVVDLPTDETGQIWRDPRGAGWGLSSPSPDDSGEAA